MLKLTHILLFVSLFVFTDPAAVICLEKGDSGAQEATDAPSRNIPQLEAGKWEPLFEMGESVYPSVLVSIATMKEGIWKDKQHLGDPWGVIGVAVRGIGNNCPVSVEISGVNFIKPSVFNATLDEPGTVYCLYPELKYDYEKFLSVKQTVPEILIFKVKIGDNPTSEKDVRIQVRPINEAVFYFVDSSGNVMDTSFFFAAFVNENHPIIKQIMKEAIDSGKVSGFTGYQDDKESVMAEVKAIWNTLKDRGVHYSAMPASADDDSPHVGTQYVRLLGESINYGQANCVDGSVLMASIFRKIGLDASLVEIPEHMFVSVSLEPEGKEAIFIETTMLGSGDCAVIISNSGQSRDLLDAAEIARKKGATLIIITASGSQLAQMAQTSNQILLAVDHPEDFDRYSPMVSRLLHLVVIDILTTAVALRLPGQTLRPMLQEIKRNLRAKRYTRAE